MNTFLQLLATFIVALSVTNLLRMTLYLVGSDVYAIKRLRTTKTNSKKRIYRPSVSLVVPVHNEAAIIDKTLEYLLRLDYPQTKLQIIIANDGSTDATLPIIKRFIKSHVGTAHFEVYSQKNGGKADVLNNAIQKRATGTLVMCLDSDSLIASDAMKKAVEYFRDRSVAALASNVNILENGTILGLVQRFEYLISYHMKKAQTVYNIEYIIGGIGSMFRRRMLQKVNFYDTNTMTEDIDLTMKIIAEGNKKHRAVYAADVITYTEAVPSFQSLLRQRFRWKYGRMQTFYKNYRLFFSHDRKYAKQLTWFMMPYSLFMELVFLLEPLVVTFIIGSSIYYNKPSTIVVAITVISIYIWINIWSSSHLTIRDRLRLSFFAPTMYVLMYLLSIVEYAALMQMLFKLPRLKQSLAGNKTTWVSPERSGAANNLGA